MARTQSAPKAGGNGVPRELTAGPPEGVPRGLVVAAAWTWRIGLLALALYAVGYVAGKLLLVVVPVFVALLLATLLVPLAHRLRDRGMHERAASLLVVTGGIALLAVVLTLIVPPFVSELGEVGTNVEQGSRKAGELLRPLGVSQAEVDKAIDDGVKSLKGSGGKLAGGAVSGALAALNVLAAVLLTFVLTFFFVKDGRMMWSWIAGLFGRHRDTAEELGERVWHVLTGYLHGVALVALIDSLLIGGGAAGDGRPAGDAAHRADVPRLVLPGGRRRRDRRRGGARRARRQGRARGAGGRRSRSSSCSSSTATSCSRCWSGAGSSCTRSWCCSR